MVEVRSVPVPRRAVVQLGSVIGAERFGRLCVAGKEFRQRFDGRAVWTVNSTATGGGVAEMLTALIGRHRGRAVHVQPGRQIDHAAVGTGVDQVDSTASQP